MRFEYAIQGWQNNGRVCVSVTSSTILAEYARLGLSVPESLTSILTDGIRYSNQDFDVLSHAMNILWEHDH
ncbi:MAG: hypothetical protein WCC37_23250, partial [Candidatus Sulfotelmatobacter sp.]